jgi:SAM-dependent methyltransferase
MKEIALHEHWQRNYRDAYAGGASEWRRRGALAKADNVVALCRELPARRVLEIGAGEGALLRRLSELDFGEALHALEISQSGVDAISRAGIPRLVECRLFDGYAIPHGDDHFDVAILSHVLEHVEQLLYEASRVAHFVFVEVPLEDTLRLPRDFRFDPVGHINAWSPTTLRRLVQSCGLRVLRQITANPARETYTYRRGLRGLFRHAVKALLLAAAPGVATRLFTYHGALVCERGAEAPTRERA